MLKLGPTIKRTDMPEEFYISHFEPNSMNQITPVECEMTFAQPSEWKEYFKKIVVKGRLIASAWFTGMGFDHSEVTLSGVTGGKGINLKKAIHLPFGWTNCNNGMDIYFVPSQDSPCFFELKYLELENERYSDVVVLHESRDNFILLSETVALYEQYKGLEMNLKYNSTPLYHQRELLGQFATDWNAFVKTAGYFRHNETHHYRYAVQWLNDVGFKIPEISIR